MQSLLILGRQPAIGLAELESLYGSVKIKPIGSYAALVDVDPCLLAFDRLGGSIKFTKVLSELNTTNWTEIEKFLFSVGPAQSQKMPKGKMHLGISAYGFKISPKQVQKTSIGLKQLIRKSEGGRGVRVVPNNDLALSSAQIIHNNLVSANGWELVIVKDKTKTIIAQSVKVQDIRGYSKRDQSRPFRDPKVGMLPPKLAQIIINLSVGPLPKEATQSVCDIPPDQPIPPIHFKNSLLLDPFCGTGVILQEASIMGYECLGSDIDERMIRYSKANIDWLRNTNKKGNLVDINFELGDATKHVWATQPKIVASETYLGWPLSSLPSEAELKPILNECNDLLKAFLSNLAPQISSGTRLCLAVPAWKRNQGDFTHLPLLDSLGVIGYNRVSFKYSGDDELIYYRPNQIVGRELLVLKRT